MKWLLLMLTVFQTAEPGYRYEFPRDHFSHPDFQTEWWYYTGNLTAAGGRRFGFELTFFRQALYAGPAKSSSPWEARDVYLAHLALTDVDAKQFYATERVNRAGPGLAGASLEQRRYWNGNWEVRWTEESQRLRAVAGHFSLDLEMRPAKPFVIHGRDGISRKSAGHASHYLSYPRLTTSGQIQVNGQSYSVTGLSWRDHEFFSGELAQGQAGWDWFSMHLSDGADLMLYRLREKTGGSGAYTAGTYIDPRGRTRALGASDLQLTPGRTWKSDATGAAYPVEWRITIPPLQLDLTAAPQLDRQELVSRNRIGPSYWEGAMTFQGQQAGRGVRGQGYLEMTGYDQKLQFHGNGRFAVR